MKRVLFVDDEPSARDFVVMATEAYEAPFVVDTASGILEAKDKLNTIRYDAVVLDVSLPGMSGSTFSVFVRKAFPNMPIAFLTGYDSDSAEEVSNEICAEYWKKTVKMTDFAALQECVENLLLGKSCDGVRSVVPVDDTKGTGKVVLPETFLQLVREKEWQEQKETK